MENIKPASLETQPTTPPEQKECAIPIEQRIKQALNREETTEIIAKMIITEIQNNPTKLEEVVLKLIEFIKEAAEKEVTQIEGGEKVERKKLFPSQEKTVEKLINNSNAILCIAPREAGKTTVLTAVYEKLRKDPDCLPTYLPVYTIEQGTFFETVYKEMEKVYKNRWENPLPDNLYQTKDWFYKILDLSAFLQKTNKKIVLILEEIETFLENENQRAQARLRELASCNNIRILASGGIYVMNLLIFEELSGRMVSPLRNVFVTELLPPLNLEEARAFLHQSYPKVSDKDVNKILKKSEKAHKRELRILQSDIKCKPFNEFELKLLSSQLYIGSLKRAMKEEGFTD